jgi:PIN domain nuclease of toxin-antitoxin system
MKLYVADTHALFWYLTASPHLSAKAKDCFDEGVRGEALIYLPSIVLAEIYFLNEKLGQPIDFATGLAALRGSSQFVFVPFQAEDTLDFETDKTIPEMHDRIIVGVARRLSAACISRDQQISASGLVPTIW